MIKATVDFLLESVANDLTKVCLLALSCPESGAWLNVLPLSSIGLRMDDDVIRIAVGLHLGFTLCHPHACSDCGAEVNVDGIHGLSCRYSRGHHSRHSALNDIVKRSLEAAKIPCHGAIWSVQIRWKASRWSFSGSLAEGENFSVGCNMLLPTGR